MERKMDIPALHTFLAAEFGQLQGQITVTEMTEPGLRARLRVQEQDLRPGNTVSGPSMFKLADVAAYLAILSRIGPVALAVTTNCAIDFMRKPAAGADIYCDVRILKLGRQLAVCDTLIYSDGQDQPVARANLTYAIPPK